MKNIIFYVLLVISTCDNRNVYCRYGN